MKLVKTYPKYKCDFCKKKAVEYAMKKHEITCYYNPNRVCRDCNNTGKVLCFIEHGDYTIDSERQCGCVDIIRSIKNNELYNEI